MKLFDAHCHLVEVDALERAAAAGVAGMAICGTSSKDWKKVLELAEMFPTFGKRRRDVPIAFPMIGIHPWFVPADGGINSKDWKNSFQTLEKTVRDFPDTGKEKGAPMLSVGIGETGLDFCDRFENRAEQEASFAAHLDLARELNRPVTVHCVQAWGRLIEILREHPAPKILLHAYSGSAELVDELIRLNCWFSFGGAVMNPNAKKLRAAVAAVPADRLLIETDSPDFPPAGCDAPNEPANLIHVARAVAELRGVSVEEIADLTFNNAQKIFFDGMTG